ncbi:MAG: hypothetical protein CVU51_02260 [Deltaproteobacteria bacterium HGW-Deltaproteobacteria-1]|nr:MAG: hypothetical protein CVU51_02260 [Deltaproteobacteria bacterium HGW-Deltaproteobacteria-1]
MNRPFFPKDSGPETEMLLEAESALFFREYKKHFVAGETKPPGIGKPFFLRSTHTDTGVLLIHGLMAAPEEVREWADFLHTKGLTVYAPRLSGHGTSSKDLSTRNYQDWLDSVDRGVRRITKEFMANDADNPHINYLRCPVSAFVQVKKLMRKVGQSLPDIKIPSLVIQANHDPKVNPGSGPEIFKRIGSAKKHFSWIDYHQHGIVRGNIAAHVFKEVESFLASCGLMNPVRQ